MLHFFFNRKCFMVRLMEVVGLAGLLFVLWRLFTGGTSALESVFTFIILIEYLFIRFCSLWRWYPDAPRSLGIGLQFEKAMVPTSYILAIMTWLFAALKSSAILLVALVLLAVVLHVNIILLFLHFKDRDRTSVNAFSMTH